MVPVLSSGTTTVGTLQIQSNAPLSSAPTVPIEYDVIRDDGQALRFTLQNGVVNNQPGVSTRLAVTGSGFTVTDDDDNVEVYNTAGVLQSITSRAGVVQTISYDSSGLFHEAIDSFGNSVTVARNSWGAIGSITTNGGAIVQYAYDGAQRLATVTNLDGTTRSYAYGNSGFQNSIASEVDENGTQFSTWGYDNQDRATSTQEAGGAGAMTLVYNSNGSVTTTDALGAVRTFTYTRVGDMNQSASISGSQCPTCQDSAATTYDSAGWVASRTDYSGNLTCYANDVVRGLELVRVEGFAPGSTCPSNLSTYTPASGTPQRKITTQWSTTWREPALVTEPNRTTVFAFYSNGTIHTKTITDTSVTPNVARTWTYTYNGFGQVLTVKGPRTDVNDTTTYAYYTCSSGYQCGQINTVTNALGQITTFSTYNAYGHPLTGTDANSVPFTLTYDARQRITSSQLSTETTGYTYYPTGLLKLVTLPDSSTILIGYDGAHRLTDITDTLGDHIHYTLDALGNRTADNVYDPSSTLHRTHTRVFNTLSQLYQDINAAGTAAVTTTFGYDAQGNQKTIAAPLSRNTTNAFDALNRLNQITDPASGITKVGYDANDNLASVQDPRSFTTAYTHDGFNELTQRVSPDTGTSTYGYNSGGLIHAIKDARGITGYYDFDALNRLTQNSYPDQTIFYTYDHGANGIGRLTGASDSTHTMTWTYDALGRVIAKSQSNYTITKSVGYGYTNGDRVSLVTPSGQTVTYQYTNHRVTSVAVNTTTILSNVTYEPFGAVASWKWGDGTVRARTYTQDGNLSTVIPGDSYTYQYDNALRTSAITDNSNAAMSWSLGYDSLDRLNAASKTGTTYGWTFDGNGNPLTQTGTTPTTFSVSPTSNQLVSTTGTLVRTYAYDAVGNTTGYGNASFVYNDRGRMSSATVSGATTHYFYNALGQLNQKNGTTTTFLMYDEEGHLIGEYASNGSLIQETVWMGDTPIATLRPNGTSITLYYVETDALNTPRAVARTSDHHPMWSWNPDPFGTVAPNQNPYGFGTFIYNLRFPGQYYQAETGLNYNYFRDYDPQTGRYIESDPIGLRGGINTYAYANGSPVYWSDRLGLKPGDKFPSSSAGALQAAAVDALNWVYQTYGNVNTEYAGSIFLDSEGNYVAQPPNPGSESDVAPSYGPGGYNAVQAYYHTHGKCLKNFDNDHFSKGYPRSDLQQADWHLPFGVPSFLGTPGHIILRYDPDPTRDQNGPITPIQNGTPCPCNANQK
jgi:RHS repeat-associated protein